MAYRWSLDGPGFEFPTPYSTENRFLRWRGRALLALAVLVVLVLALAGENPADRPVLALENLPDPGSVWPHVGVALLLATLGGLDLLRASRQQALLLVPGQPASLVVQVRREGSGSSPGAPWLMRALGGGKLGAEAAATPPGPWARQLAARMAQAPTSVQAYLQLRLSQRALVVGLSLLLAAATAVLGPWLANRPAALALIALLLALLGAAVVARQVLEPETLPIAPGGVALLLGAALLLALPLAAYADRLPLLADKLQRLGLPLAVAVLLAGGLLLEWLGVWAACANPDLPQPTAHTAADELSLSLDISPPQLMREIDLELHRRWPDGVPNRRYAWLPPQVDPALVAGPFNATVLEESQPRFADLAAAPLATTAAGPAGGVAAAASRRRALLLLNTLALLFSVAGGLLWARVAYAHMHDGSAPWTMGTAGLACLLLGAQAVRVAHVLWSRVEVGSTVTWLDFQGRYARLDSVGAGAEPTWARNEAPARIESVTLRACVAQIRSVFYAAAGDDIGSRTVLRLAGDAVAAGGWMRILEGLVRSTEAPARAAVAALPEVLARDRRVPDIRPVPPPRRPVRFCPECGTPVLQAARFCQHCGSVVGTD